jgi:hypothetical protein
MFSRNRDKVLSISIQSLGYNSKSNQQLEKTIVRLIFRLGVVFVFPSYCGAHLIELADQLWPTINSHTN